METQCSLLLTTHSATPVSAPKVTSGNTRSAGSSNRYPISETAQHEPTAHSAIEVDLGIPVIAPFLGRGLEGNSSYRRKRARQEFISLAAGVGGLHPHNVGRMLPRSWHRSTPSQPVRFPRLMRQSPSFGFGPATFFLSTPGVASAPIPLSAGSRRPRRGRRLGVGSCRRHNVSRHMLESSNAPGRFWRVWNGAGQQFADAPRSEAAEDEDGDQGIAGDRHVHQGRLKGRN